MKDHAETLIDILNVIKLRDDRGITFINSSTQQEFLSYKQLYELALRALSFLQKHHVNVGNELVFQIEDNKTYLVVFWACILGGVIPVPLSIGKNDSNSKKLFQVWPFLNKPFLVADKNSLKYLMKDLESAELNQRRVKILKKLVCVEDILSSQEPGIVQHRNEEDIAFIQFSSGSTGDPKGVVLTHANLIANLKGIGQTANYTDRDKLLSWMPLTHDMGMIGFHLNPLYYGLNQFLIPTSLFIRNPMIWLDKVSEYKVSITCSPNFGYRYILKYLKEEKNNWDLSNIRIIYNGAEPISADLCQEFNDTLLKYGLKNNAMRPVYGLAEASVAVSMSDINNNIEYLHLNREKLGLGDRIEESESFDNKATFVNVGPAVDYCSIRITDEESRSLEENVIGQVRIKGRNVTAGYYNNDLATQNAIDKEGWLNTGDLGFQSQGSLFITGRAKDIIFINGMNFYAHDIEREAETIEGIELNKIAVCGSINIYTGLEEVIAFVFHRGSLEKLAPTAQLLKRLISEKFGFELNRIIPVNDIPRTTSGKLQRFKLLERFQSGEFNQVEREFCDVCNSFEDGPILPVGQVEEKLLRIWEDVLKMKSIGVETSFLHLGGNSLKAAEVVMRVRPEFHVELAIEKLFEFPTVRKLAAEITKLDHKEFKAIPKADEMDSYPLTPLQKRIFYSYKLEPDSIAYNMPVAIRLNGVVNIEKLERCLRSLVVRHDALRITCCRDNGTFSVLPSAEVKLDLILCPKEDWDRNLVASLSPFDLAQGALFEFTMLGDIEAGEHVLLLNFHHIISDGQSAYSFVTELFQLYRGEELTPLTTSFGDFASWNLGRLADTKKHAEKYWTQVFTDDVHVLDLPYDFSRPPILNLSGKKQTFKLKKEVSGQLKKIATDHGVTAHAIFFALYNIFLAKHSGQSEIIVGVPVHGRIHPDLQNTHGMFVNTLPMRVRIDGNASFSEFLNDGFDLINETIDHQDFSMDELMAFLHIPVSPGRNPLFDTMFLYQSLETGSWNTSDFKATRYSFDPGFSKFDITMEVFEGEDGTSYAFEYSSSLFKDETIVRFSEGFHELVNQVIKNPKILIADMSPLTSTEYHDVVVNFNATESRNKPFRSVTELFDDQVNLNPDNVALEYEGRGITYLELDIKARQIASSLTTRGILKGDLVAINMDRSPELVAAILGTLKAGAAYLPLETGMPSERLKFILADSRCKFLIRDSTLSAEKVMDHWFLDSVDIDSLFDVSYKKHTSIKNNRKDLAYVMYTSGTTGLSKGAMIQHGSLSNYITWACDEYVGDEPGSFALYSSISFDLTVTSIFVPLVTGNKAVIYKENEASLAIERVIEDNQVDIVKLTPSHLRILLDNELIKDNLKIKKFIVGGEALDTALAGEIHQRLNGDVEIFNEYGPTEATVGCMIYKFDPADPGRSVPIGRPIANTEIYLLDKFLSPTPINVPGEIYIAGDGLASGYLFRDSLTEQRFVNNPFRAGCRMYKTGDIAKRLSNGNIDYIGRRDKQAKINGHRIELTEIESHLNRYDNIKESVAEVDKNKNIMAYFVPADPYQHLSELALRNYLAERLSYMMIPREFICVDAMPLTRNGKIDIEKLRKIGSEGLMSKERTLKNENRIQKILTRTWKDILNTNEVTNTSNFFELGGDSIKAVQLSSRLFEEGLLVKAKDILTYHTIENISRYAEYTDGRRQYEQGIVEGELVPTPVQNWFFRHAFKNPNYYNQSILFKVNFPVHVLTVLERTVKHLISHHDTLRINWNSETRSFFYNNDHLRKDNLVQEFDLNSDQELSYICNEIRNSFNIGKSLLIQFAVIRKPDGETFLFITAHHLIMDGMSWRILLEDFYKVYSSLVACHPFDLPQKTASFKDWSILVNQKSRDEVFKAEEDYWRANEDTALGILQESNTHDFSTMTLRKLCVSLEPEMTNFLLKGAHTPYNTDVPILLNAALVLALNKLTGLEKFIVEQENHGRHLDELDTSRTIGWFTTSYPIRLRYESEIDELIKSTKETLRSVRNKGIGYGINTFLGIGKDQTPKLPDVRMNYLGQFGVELDNELMTMRQDLGAIESDPCNSITAKLELNSFVVNGHLQTEIIYSSELLTESDGNEFARYFMISLIEILSYLQNVEDYDLTPSDFDSVDLDEEELRALFG